MSENDWDEYKAWRQKYYDDTAEEATSNTKCQCEGREDCGYDCPGVENCPYSDKGEEE